MREYNLDANCSRSMYHRRVMEMPIVARHEENGHAKIVATLKILLWCCLPVTYVGPQTPCMNNKEQDELGREGSVQEMYAGTPPCVQSTCTKRRYIFLYLTSISLHTKSGRALSVINQ